MNRDKEKFKAIFSFVGWNFTSNMGDVAIDQGINILINLFFGPAINAARGIAFQIKGQVASFCTNFQVAANPQITKYYAAGDYDNMAKLVLQSSKISFYLMFIVSLPAYVGMEMVLQLWLREVPEYTLIFARLVLVNIVINSLGGTINTAIQATGRIKKYVLLLSLGKFFAFSLTLVAFKIFKASPEYSIYCTIFYACISLAIQYIHYSLISKVTISSYIKEVVLKAFAVVFMSVILVYMLYGEIYETTNYLRTSFLIIYSFAIACAMCYFLGLNSGDRSKIKEKILKRIRK